MNSLWSLSYLYMVISLLPASCLPLMSHEWRAEMSIIEMSSVKSGLLVMIDIKIVYCNMSLQIYNIFLMYVTYFKYLLAHVGAGCQSYLMDVAGFMCVVMNEGPIMNSMERQNTAMFVRISTGMSKRTGT